MFTITKGIDNEFVFTIKADGTTEVLAIEPTYTFEFILRPLDGSADIVLGTVTGITNANGKVPLTITAAVTDTLVSEKGPKEDRYYGVPTYSMIIDCDTGTSVNGKFIARIPEVRVL